MHKLDNKREKFWVEQQQSFPLVITVSVFLMETDVYWIQSLWPMTLYDTIRGLRMLHAVFMWNWNSYYSRQIKPLEWWMTPGSCKHTGTGVQAPVHVHAGLSLPPGWPCFHICGMQVSSADWLLFVACCRPAVWTLASLQLLWALLFPPPASKQTSHSACV